MRGLKSRDLPHRRLASYARAAAPPISFPNRGQQAAEHIRAAAA